MELRQGYKQTEIGVIPENWEAKTIGDVVAFSGGSQPPRSTFLPTQREGYIRLIQIRDYKTDEFATYIPEALAQKRCNVDDIMIGRYGPPIFQILRGIEGAYNVALIKTLPSKFIDREYLFYFLKQDRLFLFIESLSRRSSGQTGVEMPALKGYGLPLPPLAEQRAITSALSVVDALISTLNQLIAKKRDIKQAAMQQLLTGKQRLPGFCGEWKTRELGEVISHCSSGATPYRGRPEFYNGNVKWITSGELNYNIITDTLEKISKEAVGKTNLKIHPAGTFLMAITGLEAAGTRGACGIVGSPATTNQSCMAIYPTPELSTEYLYHYYVYHGNKLALKYCQGTKQQSYTAKLVRILPINLPPSVEEQKAIVAILSDMDAEIAALEQRREKTRALKQGMMQELLTGKTRLVEAA
jgi:type I restriction enzyme S subunit